MDCVRHRGARRIGSKRLALLGSVSVSVLIALGTNGARAQSGPFVYVPNNKDNSVSVIDTPTNTVAGSASVGDGPIEAAVRGDGSLVYVTNINDFSVSVINTATNTVFATIPVNNGPQGIALSPDGQTAYVTNTVVDEVSVINTVTNTVTTTIPVGRGVAEVAVSPNGDAYVTSSISNTVSVINPTTNTVTTTIPVGNLPGGVAVNPNGNFAYVTNFLSDTVSVINTATNTVIATIPVGTGPGGVAVSPNGIFAYVANSGSNTASIINTATNTVIATIPVGTGPEGVAVSPDGNFAYVTNEKSNTVSVINTATNTVIGSPIPVGGFPVDPGVCGNGNALLASGLTFRANTSGALACSGASGPIFTGGTMQFAGANIASSLPITLGSQGGIFDTSGNNAMLSGSIGGPGGLTKIGLGTLVLTGANTYSGATNINGGTLEVDGSIAASSSVTVNAGGTLSGTGIVDPVTTTIMSGGTLAPGPPGGVGTLTITGNLAFASGALYLVQVTPAAASSTTVSGTATLAGTVQANFASGSDLTKQYTILTATGGVNGTFASLTNTNLPAGFTDSLSTSGNSVFLNLTANLGAGAIGSSGLNPNQQSVANGLNNFFNSGGTLPANFVNIFGLTGGSLSNALTQLSGEAATDAQKGSFQLMNQFLDIMLDPFAYGSGHGMGGGGANGFAPEQDVSLPSDVALAYAKALKAPAPQVPQNFDQRWSAWGSGFGGASHTDGNAATGTNNVTASDYGYAAGMDYHVTPDTVYGFALAGGGTNWDLAQGLGSGRSDAFQVGLYGKTHAGPAYLFGALAFANHWFTTDRIAMVDQLRATFTGQSYAARLEGGYRYAVPITGAIVGVTPYAALQAQDFHTPSYTETDLNGGGFGLSYGSLNAANARSELGARFDNLQIVYGMPLILRGRLAWAHDWITNPTLGAVFEVLPGSNFTVNGAAPPKNSALTTAAAELRITPSWTAIAKFDGEFGSGSQLYAGTGTLRYTW